ncbi:hypothetical protein [Shewanella sp. T24-MNA-CIBAN-0130]|uniref:hypothetical protein n=1 Tax=Shewanella sp. T24-MNA-CIBAN-0130 TaxID=3140470 RepID=UPI00331CC221
MATNRADDIGRMSRRVKLTGLYRPGVYRRGVYRLSVFRGFCCRDIVARKTLITDSHKYLLLDPAALSYKKSIKKIS